MLGANLPMAFDLTKLPPGSFQVPFGFVFHISDAVNPAKIKPRTFPDAQIPIELHNGVWGKWAAISAEKTKDLHFQEQASLMSPSATVRAQYKARLEQSTHRAWTDAEVSKWLADRLTYVVHRSVSQFLRDYPQLTLKYADLNAPAPTADEQISNKDGIKKFIARGGYLLYKPVLDGSEAISKNTPRVCTAASPDGKTCTTFANVDPEGYEWGFYTTRMPGALIVTMKRLAKGTWDTYVKEPLESAVSAIGKVIQWACNQAVTMPEPAGADPTTRAAWATVKTFCGIAYKPSPPTPLPDVPAPTVAAFPAGSIAYHDLAINKFRIAAPVAVLAGLGLTLLPRKKGHKSTLQGLDAVTHQEVAALDTLPSGVTEVTKPAYDHATLPWYRQTWFLATAAVVGGAAAAGGGIVLIRRNRR